MNREFTAERPNQKWVTDITYLPYRGTFLYLSAIKDLYSKEIVAYQISHRNDLDLVLNTLDQANAELHFRPAAEAAASGYANHGFLPMRNTLS
ncbi:MULTISPECIES: DDE-type integrase/transposase/recombinase [unclassified Paenibacillus]|uniref:DDE-type integrase/transposase/recombinase n=1 Tax=unclassified Paenibacillus TaxID=185978 RepID=UPI003839376D